MSFSENTLCITHGLSVSAYRALSITVHPLSALCQLTEVGRKLMRTSPIVQAFFFRAWVIVDGLNGDEFADPLRPGDKNIAALIRANMCTLGITSLDDTQASLPVSIFASVAGGIFTVASLAPRYMSASAFKF